MPISCEIFAHFANILMSFRLNPTITFVAIRRIQQPRNAKVHKKSDGVTCIQTIATCK